MAIDKSKDNKKNLGKRKNNSKFDLKTVIILGIVVLFAIYTIIQSSILASAIASATRTVLEDFVNGKNTSYIYDLESRG